MGQSELQRLFDLADLDVFAVGLVPSGAVGEEFFLLKQELELEQEGSKMMSEEMDLNFEEEEWVEIEHSVPPEGVWQKLAGYLRQMAAGQLKKRKLSSAAKKGLKEALSLLHSIKGELSPGGVKAIDSLAAELDADYGYPNPEEEKPVEKLEESQVEPEQVTASARPADEMREQLATILKAQEDLRSRLEKATGDLEAAKATAAEERDLRLQREYLEKASEIFVPGETEEIAGMLKWASETDAEKGEKLFALLKASGDAMVGAGLFAERGTSSGAAGTEPELLQKAQAMVAAGDIGNLGDAIKAVMEAEPAIAAAYVSARD